MNLLMLSTKAEVDRSTSTYTDISRNSNVQTGGIRGRKQNGELFSGMFRL